MASTDGSNGNGVHKGEHFKPDAVIEHGGPPRSTFKWSPEVCRLLVFIVWAITPLSWTYLAWTVDCFWTGKESWTHGLPLPVHLLLLAYIVPECIFSIYYRYLAFQAQNPTPLPAYSRAFLRQTLARALENGMKGESPEAISKNLQPESPQQSQTLKPIRPRARRATFSNANFSQLSFLDQSRPLAKDDPRAVEWREMFKNWFLGTKWEDLKRDNVLEWLAWSCYAMSFEDVVREYNQEGRPELPQTIQDAADIMNETPEDEETSGKLGFLHQGLYMLEARAGYKLPEGKKEGVKSIRLHLDPVRATGRPLAKYLVTGLFNKLIEGRIRRAGFEKHTHGGLSYYIRIPANWQAGGEDTRPVLFIHGLGMGLSQYAAIVSYFEQHASLQKRPMILLLQPHLSMDIFHPEHLKPPTKAKTTAGLKALVQKWGFGEGVTLVSHSNGTIVAGWLLKDCPELIKRACFIDPVTFCLWEPSVAYNFLYRTPKTGIEILMRYFVGEELGIALLLQRYFDWSANILWFEEIPKATDTYRTAFFLAENDSILDAGRVARYLKDHGAKYVEDGGNLHFLKGLAHGEALITGGKPLVQVMNWLTQEGPISE